MNKNAFFTLANDFAETLRNTFFKEEEGKWEVIKRNKTLEFGTTENTMKLGFKKNGMIAFDMKNRKEKKEERKKYHAFLLHYLKEKEIDIFVRSIEKKQFPLVPTGENSAKLLTLMESIPELTVTDGGSFVYELEKHPIYYFETCIGNKVGFNIYIQRTRFAFVENKEEIQCFLETLKNETKKMNEIEQRCINFLIEKDATGYVLENYRPKKLMLFHKTYPFYVEKVVVNNQCVFKGQLNELIFEEKLERFEEKLFDYCQKFIYKKRIKAAIKGKAYDVRGKLLHAIHPNHYTSEKKYELMSDIPMNELSQKVAHYLQNEKPVLLPSAYCEAMNRYFRKKGPTYKKAFQLNDLYVFYQYKKITILSEKTFKGSKKDAV